MKHTLTVLLSALLLVSCGSGGDSFDPTPEQLALAECTGADLGNLAVIYGEILDLFQAIPLAPAGGTYNSGNGVYTLATSLGGIGGVVSSTFVIVDGIDVGESATATWELNGGLAQAASVTGEGSFTIARPSSTLFSVSGNGEILDGTCDFTYTNLTFNVSATGGLTGTVLFTVEDVEGTLTGTMTFNGSDVARVAATVGGVSFTFYINLTTFEVTF